MKNEDVKHGDHCWAISNGELLVVMKTRNDRYEVCGAWECGMAIQKLELIEIIPRPKGQESTKLYYLH